MTTSSWTDTFSNAMLNLWSEIVSFLPNLLAATFILIIGYFLAKLIGFLVEKLLIKIGLNQLAIKIGMQQQIDKTNLKRSLSSLFALSVKWLIFLTFFLSATETLGLPKLTTTLDEFILYIPKLIGAGFIIIVGFTIGHALKKIVTQSVITSSLDYSKAIANILQTVTIIVAFSLALGQLELETSLLNTLISIIFGTIMIAMAIALGIGTRETAQRIITGIYARELFKHGDEVEIEDIKGKLHSIGTVKTTLVNQNGDLITLPNETMISAVVKKTHISH
jgi:small-conductance mechanosensitive channel